MSGSVPVRARSRLGLTGGLYGIGNGHGNGAGHGHGIRKQRPSNVVRPQDRRQEIAPRWAASGAKPPSGIRTVPAGYATTGIEVEVAEAGARESLEVRLRPSPGLTLHVLRSSGWPALEVEVLALDDRGREVLRGVHAAGEDGRVSLSELPAGAWRLLVGEAGAATASVRVRTPGPPVTVRLPPAGGLRIHVPTLAGTGLDARLSLRDPAGRLYRALPYGTYAWTVADGRLFLPLLPAGDWTLEVRTMDEGWIWTRAIHLAEGQVVDVYLE